MSFAKRLLLRIAFFALLAVTLTACSTDAGSNGSGVPAGATEPRPTNTVLPAPLPTASLTAEPTSSSNDTTAGFLPVDSVDVMISLSQPVQVSAHVVGNLPDACTKRDAIIQARNGNTFVITIPTTRPASAMCAQVLTPYQESIPLDTTGLAAGSYTVAVNGVSATFDLPSR